VTIAIVVLVAAAAAAGPAAAPEAAAPTPTPAEAVVRDLDAGLLGAMKAAGDLDYQGRFESVAPVVDDHFDVPFMAEKSLGRAWDDLGDADKAKWMGLFREFMIANYAGRFQGYKGETFEQLGSEEGAYDTVLVRTRLVVPNEENVDLDYRLRETPEGWRIVDVYLKGSVSELALRRSDYTAVVKRGGFEALVSYLREKIEALKSGTAE
jgi:phospholipid transport system substrate-binding protein